MVFIDGAENVWKCVADGLRFELLPLPVKQQPTVGDFVLCL